MWTNVPSLVSACHCFQNPRKVSSSTFSDFLTQNPLRSNIDHPNNFYYYASPLGHRSSIYLLSLRLSSSSIPETSNYLNSVVLCLVEDSSQGLCFLSPRSFLLLISHQHTHSIPHRHRPLIMDGGIAGCAQTMALPNSSSTDRYGRPFASNQLVDAPRAGGTSSTTDMYGRPHTPPNYPKKSRRTKPADASNHGGDGVAIDSHGVHRHRSRLRLRHRFSTRFHRQPTNVTVSSGGTPYFKRGWRRRKGPRVVI